MRGTIGFGEAAGVHGPSDDKRSAVAKRLLCTSALATLLIATAAHATSVQETAAAQVAFARGPEELRGEPDARVLDGRSADRTTRRRQEREPHATA